MKPNVEPEPIRALFSDLRRKDARDAPPFDQVCRAAPRPRRTVPRAAWTVAAAAAVVLGVLAASYLVRPPAPPVVPPPAVTQANPAEPAELAISRWHSPTEFLLELPAPR